MKNTFAIFAAAALALPALAQEQAPAQPSPNDIVSAAPDNAWVAIAPEDLLVMTLALDAEGNEREVVIQLMPAPFSQGWVENIRTLARAKWYDGISVNRVQDNYVVQWGDPGHDNPEGEGIAKKPLPEGLKVMGEDQYAAKVRWESFSDAIDQTLWRTPQISLIAGHSDEFTPTPVVTYKSKRFEGYPAMTGFSRGWPVAGTFADYYAPKDRLAWPVHCYGMVGVGRNYSPDTGTGAELYTVIGHAPRHLDRNIALVGRIVSGMEHLSSLPRGSGALGFYTNEEADKRTPILSIRVVADLPEEAQPKYEYLSTGSETFAAYVDARANRRDPFFIVPAGGADICNISVPIRAAD